MDDKPPETALAIPGAVVDKTEAAWRSDPIDPAPWDILSGESVKAYEAFCAYRDMGVGKRSVPKMASETGINPSVFTAWQQKFHWVARVEAWDVYQQKLRDEAHDLFMQEQALLWERRRQKAASRKWDVAERLAAKVKAKLDAMDPAEELDVSDMIKLATLMSMLQDSALATAEGVDDSFDAHNASYEELEVYLKKWGVNVPRVKRSTRIGAMAAGAPKELRGRPSTDVDDGDAAT